MANVRKLKFGLKCLTIFPILIFYKYYYLDGVEPLYYYQKNEKDDNLPDKAQGKASQQKQSSHSNNSSGRGNSVL